MTPELDYENIDSICHFKSKRYNKQSEKNKHGQRIAFLLKSAEFFALSNPSLSRSYIKELIEICEKHLIRLKPSAKRKICKGCYSYLVDGLNSVYRSDTKPSDSNIKLSTSESKPTKANLATVTCLICTRTRRYNNVK
ncbi:ribonuclease P [Theileria orientalis]|uniref:Ribonuclease P n=1 Tax=Theileria orientalis TaxID=68886 RepID=A0A976SIR9_THEOR|nr:ribonuclease P [Theileria orientalis]